MNCHPSFVKLENSWAAVVAVKKDVVAGGGPKITGIPSALKQAEDIVKRNL